MRIQITLYIDNHTPIPVQLPDDVPVQRLLPALVKKLNLPEFNDPEAIYDFTLEHSDSGKVIADTKTLAQAGIQDGHQLRLMTEKVGETTQTPGKLTSTDLLKSLLYRLQDRFAGTISRQEVLTFLVWGMVAVIGIANLFLLLRGREASGEAVRPQITEPAVTIPAVTEQPGPLLILPEPLVFDYAVVDAEFNLAQDRLVMISQEPQALHIYEPTSGKDTTIFLSHAPFAVSISPNGQLAAVGHDKFVSYLDLEQGIILKVLPLTVKVFDIVLRDDGWMYLGSQRIRGTQEAMLWAVHVDEGSELAMLGQWSQWSAYYRLHPNGQNIYATNHGNSPDDVVRIKLIDGIAMLEHQYPYHSEHEACGNLWLSESGDRVFTACGNVFRTDADPNEDLIYDGRLVGTGDVKSLVHSAAADRIVAVPFTNKCAPEDRAYRVENFTPVLRIYEGTNLNLLEQIKLPTHQSRLITGCFVFINQSGTEFYVLVHLPEFGLSGLIISDLLYEDNSSS